LVYNDLIKNNETLAGSHSRNTEILITIGCESSSDLFLFPSRLFCHPIIRVDKYEFAYAYGKSLLFDGSELL
jgi:hypothetical protein